MNQYRDPEDPYVEGGPAPETDQEWLADARAGRGSNEEPQSSGEDAFRFEAGVDENGVGINISRSTEQ